MRRFNLSAWAVAHPALILFLIVMFGVAGLLSYRNLGRAEDPSFTIKVVVVTAMWPGATAAEMQAQVADPIEKKLQELPYFDKVTTYTKPAFTAMQVAFKDNTPARDVPEMLYQLRKKVSDIRTIFRGTVVRLSYESATSVDPYMLTAGRRYAQMKKVAEALRQRLLRSGRHQGQPVRTRTKDHVEFSPPSSRRLASPQTRYSVTRGERSGAGGHCGIRRPARAPPCHRRSRRREGGRRDTGAGQRPCLSPRRYSNRDPRLCRSA
jgi:hypothetical protein